MRTLAPPTGRGWEYLTGDGLGLGRRAGRPARPAGREDGRTLRSRPATYDLVIDPSNLWLTIHESIGHATELDRALGYEAAYAGTSFATFDRLGSLQLRRPRSCTSPAIAPSSTAWPRWAGTTRGWPPSPGT